MRADRLVSLLMLLQARGRISAPELARELEVSERTIHRDILALGMAGIPVFATTGRGGGFELVENYRTTLTGLTTMEIQALSMIDVPSPLAQLGIAGNLKSALLKLAAALPSNYHEQEEPARQRIHLDSSAWDEKSTTAPHLDQIYRAVMTDRLIKITYNSLNLMLIETIVEPHGLVAKGGIWHVIYRSNERWMVKRVSEIMGAETLKESFIRSPDFDLTRVWAEWCQWREQSRQSFRVEARIDPHILPWFPLYYDRPYRILKQSDNKEKWPILELSYDSFQEARSRLLGLGGAVEVLEPKALRLSLRDFAEQAMKRNS